MARVCAPGGRVVVLEFSSPTWQPFKAIYGWYFRRVLPRIGQFFARNHESAYSYLPESVGEFPQGEGLAEKMRNAGLIDVIFRGLTLGVATIYVGRKSGQGAVAGASKTLAVGLNHLFSPNCFAEHIFDWPLTTGH
jgi:demethylmenaquinone methyltransferase/2-methoxy-6-polyprenyl-1,4-benzoquinol methylase